MNPHQRNHWRGKHWKLLPEYYLAQIHTFWDNKVVILVCWNKQWHRERICHDLKITFSFVLYLHLHLLVVENLGIQLLLKHDISEIVVERVPKGNFFCLFWVLKAREVPKIIMIICLINVVNNPPPKPILFKKHLVDSPLIHLLPYLPLLPILPMQCPNELPDPLLTPTFQYLEPHHKNLQ